MFLILGGLPNEWTLGRAIPPAQLNNQAIKNRKYRIIWFVKGERFPVVDSGETRQVKLPKADVKTDQVAFTETARPEARKQFIHTDIPLPAPPPVVPSMNVISIAAPRLSSPPRVPPPEAKRFQAPESKASPLPARADLPLPEIPTAPAVQSPALMANDSVLNPKLTRPPGQKFTPPPGGTGASNQSEFAPPPELPTSSDGIGVGTKNLAILSATPASQSPPPMLAGERRDAVQIGGIPGGPPGGTTGGGGGPAVPGLTIRGGHGPAAPTANAPTPPTLSPVSPNSIPSRTTAPIAPLNTQTVCVPQWPNARRVPPVVDMAFRDRPVCTTVLSPPNGLPNWVLWYSDATPVSPGTRVFMRPPVPRQMVWANVPGTVPPTAARTWVRARLTKDGMMVSISVENNEVSAAAISESLARWVFSPAIRNGQAIEADVLLEVTPMVRH
ncbi:MAG: hypothetical protein ABI693_03415 [Bryobacteraceae bacterium]